MLRCCATATAPSPPQPMAGEDDTGEPKTEVEGKMCARKRQRRYLHQEMFFDIVLRVPAQVLRDVMRHVCREWSLMIHSQNFIRHHLRNSTGGIVIQEYEIVTQGHSRAHNAIYVEMRRGCLEISKFDRGFEDLVFTSCNGLVLAPGPWRESILYVINPLTKQRATLPPYFRRMGGHSDFGLAFVEASMEYKVVHACSKESSYPKVQIALLTIGVDEVWRCIDIEHLFLKTDRAYIYLPLVTGGYVHWMGETFVLTLNVETETVRRFPKPQLPNISGRFLPMGSNLSFVSESDEFLWDVWEMNPETGEWNMLLSFDLEPLRNRFKDVFCEYAKLLIPFGWLADGEVLFFSTRQFQRYGIAYNVKTGEIQSFELDPSTKTHHFGAHVNSLAWLEAGSVHTKQMGKSGLSCT